MVVDVSYRVGYLDGLYHPFMLNLEWFIIVFNHSRSLYNEPRLSYITTTLL